ncbi:MAG TPA: hypothetical protein VK190_03125 [Pseudoneobacillus sp.]|jgi:hypothetical protein|nr:hypothetical protein [Pseudoneobacillus sp.]
MAGLNSVYTLSNYPSKVDNYTGSTTPLNHDMDSKTDYSSYVLAKDFNVLRDAILATQSTLGENPQVNILSVNKSTVSARIKDLESHNDDYYDQRYVGIKISIIPSGTASPTILNHVHDGKIVSGVQVNPSKIDLANHVTGTLPSANILLDIANASSLSASKIYVSSGVTIKDGLDSKLNTSGGTITGDVIINEDLYVKKRMGFSSFYEAWAGDNLSTGSGGVSFSDSSHTLGCWNGAAIRNSQKNQAVASRLTLCSASTTILRYGLYSVIFRVYLSAVPSDTTIDILHIVADDAGNSNSTKSITITSDKAAAGWNSFCVIFDHEYSATGNNQANFSITYSNTTPYDIYCDGITVVPTHTAIWG